MVNSYTELMLITATTVGKIMLCCIVGLVVTRYFSTPEESLVGICFIAMRVFMPCLLFSSLCLSVTWEQLSKFYWAPLFAFLSMGLGFLFSALVRVFLTKEYRFVVILGNTFQNGLTFPLSVLINLKGIEWFTGTAVTDAQEYIFLYNVVCSLGLWAIGDPMIANAKRKEVEFEEAMVARRRQHHESRSVNNEADASEDRRFSRPLEPRDDAVAENREEEELSVRTAAAPQRHGATACDQLRWYRPAHAKDKPITPPRGFPMIALNGEMNVEDTEEKPMGYRLKRLGLMALKSMKSPIVLSSIVGIIISLTPPLRWLVKSPLGEPFIGGMALVGKGAIPLQLLVLGASIVAKSSNDGPASSTKEAEAATLSPAITGMPLGNADGTILDVSASQSDKTNSYVRWVTSKVPLQIIFTWGTVFTRLVIIPCICFLVLHLLVKAGLMPNEKPFLLSMLVATMSPTAINSTLICIMHDYHACSYARMMFFMYLSSIITASMWLFVFTVYLKD
ncbi:putative Membrane transport protein [Leishmania shawi]|uniref:Membrane transport protein n=1 Tax=Leishmania shawi TaxID=5680 RepID=A0AAW3BWX6_9TRYP